MGGSIDRYRNRWCTVRYKMGGSRSMTMLNNQMVHGYGSIPMKNTIFSGFFTSINPSYFDVNYRGTRFWPIPTCWKPINKVENLRVNWCRSSQPSAVSLGDYWDIIGIFEYYWWAYDGSDRVRRNPYFNEPVHSNSILSVRVPCWACWLLMSLLDWQGYGLWGSDWCRLKFGPFGICSKGNMDDEHTVPMADMKHIFQISFVGGFLNKCS